MSRAKQLLMSQRLAAGVGVVTTNTSVVASAGLLASAARDPFYEPGPLRVYVAPQPTPPAMKGLRAWGQPGTTWGQPGAAFTGEAAEEPHQPRPLNALGARLATVALRMGLARLLEIHPRTDTGRRWGVVRLPTKADKRAAALQTVAEDAKIAEALRVLRNEYAVERREGAPAVFDERGLPSSAHVANLAALDDNAIHITDK